MRKIKKKIVNISIELIDIDQRVDNQCTMCIFGSDDECTVPKDLIYKCIDKFQVWQIVKK